MIQKTKRPISILLAVLMIVGMFSVLPISAGAATWTFKLNSNFSGSWAMEDIESSTDFNLTIPAGNYEFEIVANDGSTDYYRGNAQAGSSTETYSQLMHDNGGHALFEATGGNYVLNYDGGTGLLTINPVYVAEISGTQYKTLEDAFAAAADGETITLLADCAGNGIKVAKAKYATGLTVDFAGYTYTIDGDTVGSTGTETNGFQLLKDNTITFKNGTITSTKAQILVQNYSNLTLDNMVLDGTNMAGDGNYVLSNNNGNVVIDDTTITAREGCIAFDVCRYSSYPSVNVTVKGDSEINGNVEVYASKSDAKDGFSLTLESGTLNGDIVLDQTAKNVLAATPEKAVITKAAAFAQDAPADYKWDDNGVLVPVDYVAQIGSTKYETLEAAFAAAVDGDTITVLADSTGNGIKAPQGKFATGLTVDFAGHTYTVDGTTVGSTGTETQAFQLLKGNTITFKNGKLTSDKAQMIIQNYSNLTLDNMVIDGTNMAGDGNYVLSNNNGNVVINDTTINAREGKIAFDVCRYASYPSVNVTVKGNSVINGNVEVYASKSDAKDGFSLTLESGTLNGDIVLDQTAKNVLAATPEKLTVTKANDFAQAAPEGYKWVDDGEGAQTLAAIDYVAQIGSTKYETLEAAFAAAVDGDTITVLADSTGNGIKAPQGKFATGLTVDFAGHTYTVDGTTVGSTGTETQAFQLLKGNTITFKNGKLTSDKAQMIIQNYSNLTLDNMVIDGTNMAGDGNYVLSNNNGNVVINDTTINAREGKIAFDVCRYASYPSVNVTVKGNSVINGNVEVYASKSDAKDGFSLTLESGTLNGDIVLDQTAKNVLAATPEKLTVTKANDFAQAAPEGYKWVDDGEGAQTLAPDYAAEVNGTGYMTFAEAAAAANGDVITLLKDAPAYVMTPDETLKVAKNGFKFSNPTVEGAYVVKSTTAEGVTTYTTVEADIEYTTTAGKVSYKTFSSTILSANGTYKLLKDINATARIAPTVLASNITLDLNGHTLTSTASDYGILLTRAGSASSPKNFALVDTSAEKGGKLVASSADQAIGVSGKYNNVTIGEGVTVEGCVALTSENQSLTVNGTINGGNDFAIATNGSYTKNATITVNDGAVITSNVTAIYLPGTGTTTINGGEITGATGIYQKSGTLDVKGGTIIGNGAKADYTHNGNGANATGDAIVVESCNYPGGTPTLTISGNPTITSTNGVQIGDYTYQENEAPEVTATSNTMTLPEGLAWIETQTPGVYTVGEAPELFVGYGLTLHGDIGLIFYLDPAAAGIAAADVNSVSVTFDCDKYTNNTVTDFERSGDYIKVTCFVPAAYMAHDIKAYDVVINGAAQDDTDTYSVQQYAQRIIDDPVGCNIPADKADAAKTLMKEMLNYGAKAQDVFQAQMNAPAVYDNIPGYEMATVTPEMIGDAIQGTATDMSTIHPEADANFYGPSVIYLSKTTLRMYFEIPTGAGSADETAYDGSQSNWYYWVDVTDIPAAELDNQQYFEVNGVEFHYSALDYAKTVLESGSASESAKALVSALYLYNQAANEFFKA